MPSSLQRKALAGTPMVGWPSLSSGVTSGRPNDVLIATTSDCAIGCEYTAFQSGAFGSSTYPSANRALGFMFAIGDYFLVRKVWWVNGTTATTDSADVAVYTEDGATRLVAAGSTAVSGANVLQEVDVTDTLLAPGRYWCVYNQNGVTATPFMGSITATLARAAGCAQFAGAVPLGSTFTPAGVAAANFPFFGIASRTQVA